MAPTDVDYPRVVIVTVLLVVNVALVGALATSAAAYGPYNGDWDGASTLRTTASETADTRLAVSTGAYEEGPAATSLAFVLAPEGTNTSVASVGSLAPVRAFLARGGTVVVAGEGNATNAYLDAVGARARVDGRPLRDERNFYRASSLVVATNVTDHPLTDGVDSLTLNDGTVVRPRGATPLVNTSGVAYIDANGNGSLDRSDPFGTHTVATVEPVGDGAVVVVSDPSVFTNAMLERDGNRAFLSALAATRSDVVLDYTTGQSLPPLVYAHVTLRGWPLGQALVGVGAVGLVAVWTGRDRLRTVLDAWRPGTSTDDDRAVLDPSSIRAVLADRHPDWEPDRIERVTEGILRQRGREGDDD